MHVCVCPAGWVQSSNKTHAYNDLTHHHWARDLAHVKIIIRFINCKNTRTPDDDLVPSARINNKQHTYVFNYKYHIVPNNDNDNDNDNEISLFRHK